MKNFVKWFGIIAFAAVIGFSVTGCEISNDDYKMLNGVWNRGDIVIAFYDSNGVFTKINSDSVWKKVLDSGLIKIRDRKFKDIKKTNDLKWSCLQLIYDTPTVYIVGSWEDCTITMSADGKTIQTYTPNASPSTNNYTKKE